MESNLNRQQDGHPAGSTLMAALDRELSAQENSAVEEHVAQCPQCAAQWERLRLASGRVAEFHRSISTLPEFELRTETRVTSFVGILSGLIPSWTRRAQFFMPAAALATAVLGFILWTNSRPNVAHVNVTHIKEPSPPPINTPSQAGTIAVSKPAIPAAPPAPAAAIQSPRHASNRVPPRQAHFDRHAPPPEPSAPAPQTAEVFWYLPYSNPALAEQGAEMVRADLPREAFLMAGVPLANIPPAGPKERIAADVLIGADGLPRAIRPARQQTTATVIPTPL